MKISLLQPAIRRGDIHYNQLRIQDLISKAHGDLLVLPEFALTGSLVLEPDADLHNWISESREVMNNFQLPEGKELLINYIEYEDGQMYNCCRLLSTGTIQYKIHPDTQELERGIIAGQKEELFHWQDKSYKVVICTDMRYIESFDLTGVDFLLFIYHFTANRKEIVISDLKEISTKYDIPICVSSLVSDQNIGYSSYVYRETITSLSDQEGILEIEIT